jgi:transcriptional regulator with XRE-family HTH domain
MESKILKTFGQSVKKYRLKRGWSQETLGKMTGLHRTYIGSIERHERNISLLNIEKIAIALRVNIKDLTAVL